MTDTSRVSARDPMPASDHAGHPAESAPASGHGHAPDEEAAGPLDVIAWAYALAGGALGVIVALALYAASSSSG